MRGREIEDKLEPKTFRDEPTLLYLHLPKLTQYALLANTKPEPFREGDSGRYSSQVINLKIKWSRSGGYMRFPL